MTGSKNLKIYIKIPYNLLKCRLKNMKKGQDILNIFSFSKNTCKNIW